MRIYAQLYGIHDSSMDVYLSVKDHLRELIVEVLAIEREVINRRLQFESVPQFNSLLEKIGYGNLCDFISSNVTAYIFSEKNYSTCMALHNHILSKGLYSLIVITLAISTTISCFSTPQFKTIRGNSNSITYQKPSLPPREFSSHILMSCLCTC